MATSQKAKNLTSNWSDLFPAQIEEEKTSAVFVRKLVAVGISQIIYLRTEMPDRCFELKHLDGIPLKMLDPSHGESKEFCDLVAGALRGVTHRYLSELTLALYTDPEHPEEAFETYTFGFAYSPDGETSMSIDADGDGVKNSGRKTKVQKNNLNKTTRRMLRSIITTAQSFEDPKGDIFATILLKWNANTPADFEPRGFSPANYMLRLHKETDGVSAGCVKTDFHAVGAKIRQAQAKAALD